MADTTNGAPVNNELLIRLAGSVDSLTIGQKAMTDAMTVANTRITAEFENVWSHMKEQNAETQRSIRELSSTLAGNGKPNIPAIVSVLTLVGAIWFASVAPIKSDIARTNQDVEMQALASLRQNEKLAAFRETDGERRGQLKNFEDKLNDISVNGSASARERLAVIEFQLKKP